MEETINHKSNHFPRINFVLISYLTLFAGGSIYILFRPVEAKFLNWFTIAGSRSWLLNIREESLSAISFLPPWILYSLPNGFWAFAYTLIIMCLWSRSKSLMKYFWFGSIPMLVFGFEFLQLTGQLQGTFCLYDIIWSSVGIIIGILITHANQKQRKSKSNNDRALNDHRISKMFFLAFQKLFNIKPS